MDTTQYVILGLTVAGVVELLNRLRAKDYYVAATIVSAAVVGALFGLFNYYPGLDAVEGAIAGLSVSGALKGISMFGQKSTPAPSSVVTKAKQKVID